MVLSAWCIGGRARRPRRAATVCWLCMCACNGAADFGVGFAEVEKLKSGKVEKCAEVSF